MYKTQNLSVKALSMSGKGGLLAAPVDGISQKGVSAIGQMYADLVCTARFKLKFHISIISEAFKNPVMSYGILSLGIN